MLLSKDLFFKFMKYSFVGCLSTIVYFISVFVFVELFNEDPLIGSAIAFVIMTINSFLLNRKYTFDSDFSKQKLIRFLIVSAIGFILNFLIMFIIVHVLSFHYSIGEFITILVIPLINFTLNNYWTFK
jgi:putative flippase GtrA